MLSIFNNNQNSWMLQLGGALMIIALLFKMEQSISFMVTDAYQSASFSVLFLFLVFPKIFLFFCYIQLIMFLGFYYNSCFGYFKCSCWINSSSAQIKIKRFLAYTTIYNTAFFLAY